MTTHRACILLGSNIEPEQNTRRAVAMLKELCRILAFSSCWETGSVGYNGPNFINLAVLVETDLDAVDFKQKIIDRIEERLGRVRTPNKNAPRTIDLDIIVVDGEVLDQNLWDRAHVALPVSELLPDLIDLNTGKNLKETAGELVQQAHAVPRQDVLDDR
jgi:2-amino-4-hydroxy-6-hydroxymethyldihydropteridine diphosphokinase